jgi:hypothetical protein
MSVYKYILFPCACLVLVAAASSRSVSEAGQRPSPPTQIDQVPKPPPAVPPLPPPKPAGRGRPDTPAQPPTQVEPRSRSNQGGGSSVPPRPAPSGASDQGGTAASSADCAIPAWLASESDRVDDVVVRLHKLRSLDTADYRKNAPANCAQQLFKYRISVLNQIVELLETR